jgi:hypothetical protein
MQSKNKRPQTAKERAHCAKLAQMPCVVCGDHGVEIHEFEQGQWFTAVPLCPPCHRGNEGWHGTRLRWNLRKINMLQAINKTVGALA